MPAELRIYGGNGLFYRKCECGEYTIYGFWHDLEGKEFNYKDKVVRFPALCSKCGSSRYKYIRLTTATCSRPRFLPWVDIFIRLALLTSNRCKPLSSWIWRQNMLVCWLEKHIKL